MFIVAEASCVLVNYRDGGDIRKIGARCALQGIEILVLITLLIYCTYNIVH